MQTLNLCSLLPALKGHVCLHLQISREELETAMGFLRQQLGEDELRMLLDKLNEFGLSETEEGPINVGRLMDLAQPDAASRHVLSQVEAQQRGTLQALSQKV